MQKHIYSKIGLIACIAVFAASVPVRAQDMAWASGVLAEIAAAMTQANASLAAAANGGDPDQIKAEQKKVDAVVSSSQEALAAYAALEKSGGSDTAAAKKMEKAQNDVATALGQGKPSAPVIAEQDDDDALPNPGDILWQSDGLRSLYKEFFNIVESSSAQGGDDFVESDATQI